MSGNNLLTTTEALVSNLFIKQERLTAMSTANSLVLQKGIGIKRDLNRDELSPRQVLVVLSSDLAEFAIPPGELRENIVLNLADSKTFKPGTKLTFPSGAEIRLTFYCEPCKRVARWTDSIKNLERKRGILGVVTASGAIALKDTVIIEPNYFSPLSEIPYERFFDYVARIPVGKVVTYKQILRCIGVDRSYFRVMPNYLKKAPANLPLHRILDSQGKITPHVPRQLELLEEEGIEILSRDNSYSVRLERYLWDLAAYLD